MSDLNNTERKGTITNYNQSPVTMRKTYYQYGQESEAGSRFNDMVMGITEFDKKLKQELAQENTPKLQVDGEDYDAYKNFK
jgi:hypothetical protein